MLCKIMENYNYFLLFKFLRKILISEIERIIFPTRKPQNIYTGLYRQSITKLIIKDSYRPI